MYTYPAILQMVSSASLMSTLQDVIQYYLKIVLFIHNPHLQEWTGLAPDTVIVRRAILYGNKNCCYSKLFDLPIYFLMNTLYRMHDRLTRI